MIFNSIRGRLQLWYGLILVAVLAGFGVTAYQLERGQQMRRIDGELQRRVNMLVGALRPPPRGGGRPGEGPAPEPLREPRPSFDEPFDKRLPERDQQVPPRNIQLPAQVASLFDAGDTNGFYYAMWRRDGQELAQSANAPARIAAPTRVTRSELPPPSNPQPRDGANLPDPPPRTRGEFREVSIITLPGEIVLVGRSIATETSDLRLVALKLAGVGGAILLLGLVGGWWIVSRAIRPIDDISATASKISRGDLSQRINVANTDNELSRLAGVLNSTFARLEAAFAQQQQFTSDAAHELRTPVSVILTQVQSTLKKDRSPAEYRETLEACSRAAQRMRRLIESLMELARFDAGQENLRHEAVDMRRLAQECIKMVGPLADEMGVKLIAELPVTPCRVDPQRLSQVLVNLLTNAITYNRPGGEVRLNLAVYDGAIVVTVADTGPGISAEAAPHVFKRFYRADQARAGTVGNAGLGLAICKTIVTAHGGTIDFKSVPGVGTTFTLRLPVS